MRKATKRRSNNAGVPKWKKRRKRSNRGWGKAKKLESSNKKGGTVLTCSYAFTYTKKQHRKNDCNVLDMINKDGSKMFTREQAMK